MLTLLRLISDGLFNNDRFYFLVTLTLKGRGVSEGLKLKLFVSVSLFFSLNHIWLELQWLPASIVTSTQDQIWHYISLGMLGYSVTKWPALSWELIKLLQREISDIIWYTFLISLCCGCVQLWNNRSLLWTEIHRCQSKSPVRRDPLQTVYKKQDIVEPDCARGRRNWAIILSIINGLPHISLYKHHQPGACRWN